MSNRDKRKNFAIRPAQEFKLRTLMHANDPQNSSGFVQCGLPGKLPSGGFFFIRILVAQDSYPPGRLSPDKIGTAPRYKTRFTIRKAGFFVRLCHNGFVPNG